MLKKILNSAVYEILEETPLDFAKNLSSELKNNVFLKREDLQEVFSFKIRGAYNCLAQLSPSDRKKGVIAASAGNHAQGVAFSAKKLGIQATIVMPITTPSIKVNAVRYYGAQVLLHGDNYSEAAEYCLQVQKEKELVFIHPFDNEEVIAGQGTIGLEILKQAPRNLNAIFLPIGGGGLIAGVATLVKELRPDLKIIGVEPEDSDAMYQSLKSKKRVTLPEVGIFADGVAVKQVGALNFQLCEKYVDEIILVSTDAICSAIKTIHKDTRSLVEPSGALAIAGAKKYLEEKQVTGLNVVAISSGANMNFERLSFIAERTRLGEKQEALYSIGLPETPGALRNLCTNWICDRNITEFNYRKSSNQNANIFVGLGLTSERERFDFFHSLQDSEFKIEDLTDNNLAKTHVRYMIGSRTEPIPNEMLFHFQFPERPGALKDFLASLKVNWNISLFHYRSRGGDSGNVLVGLEVGEDSEKVVIQQLETLKYPFTVETQNPAFEFFLKGND